MAPIIMGVLAVVVVVRTLLLSALRVSSMYVIYYRYCAPAIPLAVAAAMLALWELWRSSVEREVRQ